MNDKDRADVDGTDALQKRIEALREQQHEKPSSEGASLAHAVTLFMSMGFSFVGALVAAIMLGGWMAKRTGHEYWYLIGIAVGLASGISVVWRLLRPLMKSTR